MYINEILNKNNRVPFVKRILSPFKAPTLIDPEDKTGKTIMTHKMSYSEDGGKFYVYPSIMPDEKGKLKDYNDDAFDVALKKREYITFDNEKDAEFFSKNYKSYWKDIGYQP